MNYCELRKALKSTENLALPTAKSLFESGTVFLKKTFCNATLTVFTNGFFTYTADSHTTVYAVDRCEIIHGNCSTDTFEWYITLVLNAEERLENNNTRRNVSSWYSYDNICTDLESDTNTEFSVDLLLDSDFISRAVKQLTLKQQQVLRYYYFAGLTHQEIADMLGIKRPVVSKTIAAACKKLKKIFVKNEFYYV